jgi:indolepyruvate ferredoxin oxidoreductase beta subunit
MEVIMNEIEAQPNQIALDADEIAKELGSPKSANMVILGAACPFLDISYQDIQKAIKAIFGRKGEEVVQVNLNALKAGYEVAMSKLQKA